MSRRLRLFALAALLAAVFPLRLHVFQEVRKVSCRLRLFTLAALVAAVFRLRLHVFEEVL